MPGTDLTGYAALLGESLSSRVELLDRLLGDAHYPSLGQYKERLLADTIRNYLPRTVDVGTGFVMFPHADPRAIGDSEFRDPLNQSAYSVSRQCDVLIYDASRYPVVFRDGDFVIIRPEAVRAVIEVKGSLSREQTLNALDSFKDFGIKWRTTQLFYQEQGIPATSTPALYLMAWKISTDSAGRPRTTPTAIRTMIAAYYAENVSVSNLDGFPILEQLLIHNEAQIVSSFHLEPVEEGYTNHLGWSSRDGRFTRISPSGSFVRDKDRTVAALLAALHWDIAQPEFNRFFSYQEEVRDRHSVPYKHRGISHAWSNLGTDDSKRITNRLPVQRNEL